eukprot:3495947-Lingulodinium_polyedra.AAC.1
MTVPLAAATITTGLHAGCEGLAMLGVRSCAVVPLSFRAALAAPCRCHWLPGVLDPGLVCLWSAIVLLPASMIL